MQQKITYEAARSVNAAARLTRYELYLLSRGIQVLVTIAQKMKVNLED